MKLATRRGWLALTTGALVALTGCATTASKPLDSARGERDQAQGKTAVAAKPAPPPRPMPKQTGDAFKDGVADYNAGKFTAARDAFNRALEQNPRNVNAQYNLGLTYERLHQPAEAERAYAATRRMDPKHGAAIVSLGRSYVQDGKLEGAITLFESTLREKGHEHDVAILNALSAAYRLDKKYPEAEAAARKALTYGNEDAQAYQNLSLVYYEQGNYRLAEMLNAHARKLDDDSPSLHNDLGMIYLKQSDAPRALLQFKQAIDLDDGFTPGYLNLGAMALSYRDYGTAEQAYGKVVELEPARNDARLQLAVALDGQKGSNPKKGLAAGAQYEKVLAAQSNVPEAICGAGWAYSVAPEGWDKATDFLQRCRALEVTSAKDRQSIDAKLNGLATLKKSRAQQQAQAQAQAAGSAKKSGGQPSGVGGSAAPLAGSNPAQSNGNSSSGTPSQHVEPAKLGSSEGK